MSRMVSVNEVKWLGYENLFVNGAMKESIVDFHLSNVALKRERARHNTTQIVVGLTIRLKVS